jgi:putative PIN family toxin of toxin-antitoxin system
MRLVLDTNVVLDCFVFHAPAMHELLAGIDAQRVQALVNEHSLDELTRVLAYPQCRLAEGEQQSVLTRYVGAATRVTMPAGFSRDTLLLPPGFPHCRDRDDQPFLALAWHAGADALVTKDKAILKMRKKVRKFGVTVLSPAEFASGGNIAGATGVLS